MANINLNIDLDMEKTCQEASQDKKLQSSPLFDKNRPLLGYDFRDEEGFGRVYNLAEKIVDMLVENNMSYEESHKLLSMVDGGLKTLKLSR